MAGKPAKDVLHFSCGQYPNSNDTSSRNEGSISAKIATAGICWSFWQRAGTTEETPSKREIMPKFPTGREARAPSELTSLCGAGTLGRALTPTFSLISAWLSPFSVRITLGDAFPALSGKRERLFTLLLLRCVAQLLVGARTYFSFRDGIFSTPPAKLSITQTSKGSFRRSSTSRTFFCISSRVFLAGSVTLRRCFSSNIPLFPTCPAPNLPGHLPLASCSNPDGFLAFLVRKDFTSWLAQFSVCENRFVTAHWKQQNSYNVQSARELYSQLLHSF